MSIVSFLINISIDLVPITGGNGTSPEGCYIRGRVSPDLFEFPSETRIEYRIHVSFENTLIITFMPTNALMLLMKTQSYTKTISSG